MSFLSHSVENSFLGLLGLDIYHAIFNHEYEIKRKTLYSGIGREIHNSGTEALTGEKSKDLTALVIEVLCKRKHEL